MNQIKIWPVALVIVVVIGSIIAGVTYNDAYVKSTKDSVSTKQTSDTIKASEPNSVYSNDSIPKTNQSGKAKTNDNSAQKNGGKTADSTTCTTKQTIHNNPTQKGNNNEQNLDFNTRGIPDGVDEVINEPTQIGDYNTQNCTF